MDRRQLMTLALAAGLLTGGILWAAKSAQTAAFGPAPVQPDSLVYFQYARAIAEGHAYCFTPDQLPSTGSTSHLYPFVLAALIKAGGIPRLETMSFVFNGACHAAALLLVALIAWRLQPRAAPVAVLLALLSGHLAMTVFSDCDMSLFVPLALGVFAAAIHGRVRWLAILLVVAAWTRPEGMVMSVVLAAAAALLWLTRKEDRGGAARFLAAGAAGVAASLLVLWWNHHLTGHAGFDSTAHKSWFAQYPWTGALIRSAQDFMAIWSGAFWGFGSGVRPLLGVPLVGGALCLAGLTTGRREAGTPAFLQTWWIAAIVAATGLVAVGGWAGAVFDRYLGWITPFVCIYAAIGLAAIADALKSRAVFAGGAATLAILQAAGAAYFLGLFGAASADTAALAAFGRQLDAQIARDAKICTVGEAGLAFYLPGRSVMNLNGIVSPGFAFVKSPVENVEKLTPDRAAPDYLLLTREQAAEPWLAPLTGPPVAQQANAFARAAGLSLHRFNGALLAGERQARPAAGAAGAGVIDIGGSGGRSVFTRLPGVRPEPFAAVGTIGTERVLDVGEVILGSETLTVRTTPGKPLRVVMRTACSATVPVACADGITRIKTFEFASPLRLTVLCNGGMIEVERPISGDGNVFDEIAFDVPAGLIASERTELTIGGDHVALAHWFYQ